MEVSLLETPGSHTVITREDPYTLGQPRTLHCRVLVDGRWMPAREPLPGRLNARGEGLIGFNRTETGEYYWMANSTASSVNTKGKPTALWRNGKVLTLPELLGSDVDAQQVGALWDINDHGLIAANSPTHGPALLVPMDIIAHKRGTVNAPGAKVPKGTGTGEYGYETVMLENADSESAPNSTQPDYSLTGNLNEHRMANDDDLVKIVLHYYGPQANGVSLELKHEGIAVDASIKGSQIENPEDAIEVLDTGSRISF